MPCARIEASQPPVGQRAGFIGNLDQRRGLRCVEFEAQAIETECNTAPKRLEHRFLARPQAHERGLAVGRVERAERGDLAGTEEALRQFE